MNKAKEAVREHVKDKVPGRVKALIAAANYNLYYGPSRIYIWKGEEDPPNGEFSLEGDYEEEPVGYEALGFESMCRELKTFFNDSDLETTYYYEPDSGCVMESEPQGEEDEETGEWIEPETYYSVSLKDALLGKLAEYV